MITFEAGSEGSDIVTGRPTTIGAEPPGPSAAQPALADDVDLATLPASSRMRVDPAFVLRLHGLGEAAVAQFLEMHGDAIGVRSSHSPAGQEAQAEEGALPEG